MNLDATSATLQDSAPRAWLRPTRLAREASKLATLRVPVPQLLQIALPGLCVLATVFVLAGCSTLLPPRHVVDKSVTLPPTPVAAVATVQDKLAIDRWWLLFGDDDLTRLIDQALAANHDLAIAAARLRESRARLDETRAAQSPTLDLRATNERSRRSGDSLMPSSAPLINSHRNVSLDGAYEIDLWGRLAAGTDAARQRLAAQQWALASIQWSLSAQLAESYFNLRALARQIVITESVRESRGQTLALRQRERAAGISNEFELRRAEAELAGADVTLTQLKLQRTALQATVALLCGLPPEKTAQTDAAVQPLDPSQALSIRLPQGAAADLLLARPDLRQAEAELAAADADITAARAATLPSLKLTGGVGSDVRSMSNLFSGPGFVWSLAANVSQSLLDGGARRARVQEADARADAALAQYRKTVLAAVLDVREAYSSLDLQWQVQQAEQQRVASLERARFLAQLGVGVGALNQIDLLDAERSAFDARLAEVTAYRDRLIGQVAAFKALGGGHAGAATSADMAQATTPTTR